MNVVAITQARTGSTRLPNKVLMEVIGKTFLEVHLYRISKCKLVDDIVVATTLNKNDDTIASLVTSLGFNYYRGSEFDVLDRYYQAAIQYQADVIVRITSDCPLVDPFLIDYFIQEHIKHKKDFTSNIVQRTYPDGFDIEIFNFQVLKKAWEEAKLLSDREHVTYYIWKNSNLLNGNLFSSFNVSAENNLDFSHLRLTLDYPEDKELLVKLIEIDGIDKSWIDYVNTLIRNPLLLDINRSVNFNLDKAK